MKCGNNCGEHVRYPYKLTVQKPSATLDSAGHIDLTDDDNWTTAYVIRGRFLSSGGREFQQAKQTFAELTHVIETPSTPGTRTIQARWRVLWGTRTFEIKAAYDVDEARRIVRLETTEEK